ncbi:hypothetical protein WJX73_004612 [Symbiochloris irregularis]|uniref:alpha-1,2-Mannosidase n=1 Tax=Symbiochloris irregularis TaxID=706552 RepID=A0AAW1NW78_9CHLO
MRWLAVVVTLTVGLHAKSLRASSSPLTSDQGPTLELSSLQQAAKDLFDHGFDQYMLYAFPHDELKPLTYSYSDSLGELGNLDRVPVSAEYKGVALTLIDSLPTLAVLGKHKEFEQGVQWLVDHADWFDADVRINVFEGNIRLLGGLLSAHILASHGGFGPQLMQGGYNGGLLDLAHSLGLRLLPAFLLSPTGMPYAWVNLRHGIQPGTATKESNTAGCGSLVLEMGMLSRLTGNRVFETAARDALRALWAMRTPLDLLGTDLDVEQGIWLHQHGGIGAGADSFFEYLLKAYLLFGDDEYWDMFNCAYSTVMLHYRTGGPWYHDSDIRTGRPTQFQFTSLQAFWPGLQVLAGDLEAAMETHAAFAWVWQQFQALPERYLYQMGTVHPTEHYYPLRPELFESTFYLFEATRNPMYQAFAAEMLADVNESMRVPGGWASVGSVVRDGRTGRMPLEDIQPSYWLAEAALYLYLLFANDTILQQGEQWIFTTEGHPLPLDHASHRLQQAWAAGKATKATLHTHPFYREASSQWAAAFGLSRGAGACRNPGEQHCNSTAFTLDSGSGWFSRPRGICPARKAGPLARSQLQ